MTLTGVALVWITDVRLKCIGVLYAGNALLGIRLRLWPCAWLGRHSYVFWPPYRWDGATTRASRSARDVLVWITESSYTCVEASEAVGEGSSQREVTSGIFSIGVSLLEEVPAARRSLSSLPAFVVTGIHPPQSWDEAVVLPKVGIRLPIPARHA